MTDSIKITYNKDFVKSLGTFNYKGHALRQNGDTSTVKCHLCEREFLVYTTSFYDFIQLEIRPLFHTQGLTCEEIRNQDVEEVMSK